MLDLRFCSRINLHYPQNATIDDEIKIGLAFLKKSGFDAADFTMKFIEPLGDNWQECIDNAIVSSTETGLNFEVCHLPFSLKISYDETLLPKFNKDMFNAIDAAARLKVNYAVLHPNAVTVPSDCFDKKYWYDTVMSHLSPFAERAQKQGVHLCVENTALFHESYPTKRYCQTPEELCDIADALDIGICWDFGHANLCGLKQSDALRYIGKRLKTVHINDNRAITDDHVPPFLGTIDWTDVALGLKSIGYSGLFNYEITTDKIPRGARESFAQYLMDAGKSILNL